MIAAGALTVAAMVAAQFWLSPVIGWNIAWTAGALSATGATYLARQSASPPNRARWTLWMAATVSWLVGQIGWDVFSVIGQPASPNMADAGYWGFAVIVIISMVRGPGRSRSMQAVTAAETLPLIAAATALTFGEMWSDAAQSSLALLPRLSALAYPAIYVTAAVLTLQAIIGGSLRRSRSSPSVFVLAGIVVQAIAFILWCHQLLAQDYVTGTTALDPLWALGMLAIMAGGVLAARRPEAVTETTEPNRHGGVLPAAMFVVLITALTEAWLDQGPAGTLVTLSVGVVLCGVSLLARSMLLERRLRELLLRERSARAALSEREFQLATLNERLTEDSRRDPLTGLGNRRALSEDLPALESFDASAGSGLAFALCDIDHFKAYNDHLGHLAGDQALRAIAATIRGTLRAEDVAYRFGGEELLLVLRDPSAEEAEAITERVRATVARAALPHPASPEGILTVSIGVAPGPGELGKLLASADAALYEAKRLGRNRVVVSTATELAASGGRDVALPAEPMPRHVQSMLTISRAAASGRGPMPVLEALAATIRSELSFASVVVNLIDESRQEVRAVVVLGGDELKRTLLGTVNPWGDWEPLMSSEYERQGAVWLPAGSYEWPEDVPVWTPNVSPMPGTDSWQPEDELLLPLRASAGEILAVVSVDEPLSGRRPRDAELSVLMAVADHAGLALEQAMRERTQSSTLNAQSHELLLAAVMLLAETVDLRDTGTARHSRTVGDYARQTAVALGLAPERVERVQAAGVLHDLGKIGIADAILFKPGPLDETEWREMRRHAEVGARILEHAGINDIAGWVRTHHERIDGQGYPHGLPAEQIELEARILAVADAYEAMTADRPYRSAMPAPTAREELLRCAGSQFDPVVVHAFLDACVDIEPGEEALPNAA